MSSAPADAPLIAVLDYGIGNLRSAEKALEHVGAHAVLTSDADVVERASAVVLPGVGNFGRCREALDDSGLDEVALRSIASGRPFLGICVGMQLLYDGSEECPGVSGLGVLPGTVVRLPYGVKHPQMQWNRLDPSSDSPLFTGLGDRPWMYFVHSFAPQRTADTIATCDYGGPVTAVAQRENVMATQFHPEKSGAGGMLLLANFVNLACGTRPSAPSTTGETIHEARLMGLDLYPAIDLLGGRCVRLYQGDYQRETDYGDDPVSQALAFEAAGASWIHVVDLDAARTGEPRNREVVAAIVAAVSVPVQTGGGVRDDAGAEALFDVGVARVVVGTAALEDPAFVRRLAASRPVAVGLDARGREVAVRGWLERSGADLLDLAAAFEDAGVAALVVTEISRDGTLEGPDVAGLTEVLAATSVPVIASGGVGTLADLEALASVAASGRVLSGAIVGRAIYEGAFSVTDAVAVLAKAGS